MAKVVEKQQIKLSEEFVAVGHTFPGRGRALNRFKMAEEYKSVLPDDKRLFDLMESIHLAKPVDFKITCFPNGNVYMSGVAIRTMTETLMQQRCDRVEVPRVPRKELSKEYENATYNNPEWCYVRPSHGTQGPVYIREFEDGVIQSAYFGGYWSPHPEESWAVFSHIASRDWCVKG